MAGGKDRSFLIQRGTTWLVNVKVPAHLRERVGKAHLRQTTGTDSLARANALKHGIIHQLKGIIAEAQREHDQGQAGTLKGLVAEATAWRYDLQRAKEADREASGAQVSDEHPEGAWDLTTSLLADRAQEIADKEGLDKAQEFHAIAMGLATPIATLVDSWLAERPMKPRQVTDYRRAVTKFTVWLAGGRHPQAVERVTRRVAGAYISDAFVTKGVNVRTTNKDVSCLSSFWKWAQRKGIASENVWAGQSLPKPKSVKAEEPRAFTDEEVTTLFTGKTVASSESRKPKLVEPSPLLRDFMAIAALSGMRVEEIAQLTARDVAALPPVADQKPLLYFDITKAKTTAGLRRVPVHPALGDIVARRTAGRASTDSLWPELPEPRAGSPIERSQKVVKEFVAYRRKIGVDDRAAGKRQSRVTFHSWRRTFVTKAEQSGQPPHLLAVVVGHERPGETLGTYSSGPLLEQLKTVVESVDLPPQVSLRAGPLSYGTRSRDGAVSG